MWTLHEHGLVRGEGGEGRREDERGGEGKPRTRINTFSTSCLYVIALPWCKRGSVRLTHALYYTIPYNAVDTTRVVKFWGPKTHHPRGPLGGRGRGGGYTFPQTHLGASRLVIASLVRRTSGVLRPGFVKTCSQRSETAYETMSTVPPPPSLTSLPRLTHCILWWRVTRKSQGMDP